MTSKAVSRNAYPDATGLHSLDELDSLVLSEFPYPIAASYMCLLEGETWVQRTQMCINVFGIVLRFMALGLVSQYLIHDTTKLSDTALNHLLVRRFLLPTLGNWHQILFSALKAYEGQRDLLFMPELYDFYWDTSQTPHRPRKGIAAPFDRLVQIRNELAHGLPPISDKGWLQLSQEANACLGVILVQFTFLKNYDLIRIKERKRHEYHYDKYKGLQIVSASSTIGAEQDLREGWFYLYSGDGRSFLQMHPFLIFLEGGKVTATEVDGVAAAFIYDGLGQNKVFYMNALSGEVVDEPGLVGDVARWVMFPLEKIKIPHGRRHRLLQEIDSPYITGMPLREQPEIFVGRIDISARIEQLALDKRRPPLLLYGQRRMGKTSLLSNLGRLLPSTIVPLFVDLQGPASAAKDHTGFLFSVARSMATSAQWQRNLALPPLPREALVVDPFTIFDEWLDQIEQALGQSTVLLTLDELEALDSALTEGRFSETAVLGMLRHLIQHRPRFRVLLAASHSLDELQQWSSYLINVQVVHISYLKEAEARQLIEQPVKDFALRYELEASQRVLDLTRGHPFLVQLLCAEIVAHKNEQPPTVRRLARLADVEAAVPEALSHGSFFFADIQQNQVDTAGLALLRFLAAQGEGAVVSQEALARQFPDELDHTLDLLTRRELIELADGGYRFQVELIRRWFAQR